MEIGPFALLPKQLAITRMASLEEWEEAAALLFDMQKYIPWWLGDMVNFGEARFGDDFYQVCPIDASAAYMLRVAGVGKKYSPEERTNQTWTHHNLALRCKNAMVRNALLRRSEAELMNTTEFSQLLKRSL